MSMHWGVLVVCLTAGMTSGCALFPKNVAPSDSVFVDSGLRKSSDADGNVAPAINDGLSNDVVERWLDLNDPEGDDSFAARSFLSAGVSLVDARCDEYFRQLGLAAQKMSFANKELSLTTSVVAALQGLTSVGARDISLTATSLGFLNASSTAYGDVFIFSPDVSSVQALVSTAQKAAKDKIDDMEITDFSKAVAISLLQDYEKTCEVHTIRRLVNESLAAATPIASFSAADQGSALLRQAARSALAAALGVEAITTRQMAALYWLAYGDQRTDADTAALVKLLPDALLERTANLTAADPLNKELGAIRGAFRALVAVEASKLDSEAAELKKAVLEEAGEPSSTVPPMAASGTPSPEVQKAVRSQKLFAPTLTIRIKQ